MPLRLPRSLLVATVRALLVGAILVALGTGESPRADRPLAATTAVATPSAGQGELPTADRPLAASPAVVTPSPAPTVVPSATSSPVPLPSASPTPRPTLSPPLAPLPAGEIPILYYHRVVAPPQDFPTRSADRQKTFLAYDVLPAAFTAQLDWLKARGYTTILPRDLVAHWTTGRPLPSRPVIITFDDGTPDWLTTVVPLLRAQGFTAEFYLTIDAIRHPTLTWDQVRWIVGQGMGLGAHDVHHVQLAMLGANRPPASPAVMAYEVTEARRIIEQETGKTVDSMAYVGGGFDATLVAAVRAAGYTSARSVVRGVIQSFDQRFVLRVVRVGVYDDVLDVIRGIIDPALPVFTLRMSGVQPN